MKILQNTNDLNIVINSEQNFQTDLGWQDNLTQFEDEVLKDIINPADNYETVRFIHKDYPNPIYSAITSQTDIWFQFYFLSGSTYIQDYEAIGITKRENELMLKQSTESFFRLEFFKTPISGSTYETPTRQNRRLVFTKNLSLPLGEKFFYTGQNFGYFIHVPVFMGSNYKNKENMYLFWFEDESVLEETDLIGTETSNTFFMTAKFFNAKDGQILDFTNRALSTGATIDEKNDMYYQVDFNLTGRTYQIYKYSGGTRGERVGISNSGLTKTIQFFEKGGGVLSSQPTIAPTPISTITLTPLPTHTPYPSIQPTPTPTSIPEVSEASYYLSLEKCSNGAIVWSDAVSGAPDDPDFNYEIGTFVYDQNSVYYEVIDFQYFTFNPDPSTSIIIQGTASSCPTPTPTPSPTPSQTSSPTPSPTPGPTPTPTPSPTPSPTPTPTPFRIVANDLWVGDSGDVEFGDNTSCAHTSPINTTNGAVDAWLYSATNICDATSIEADSSLGFNWVLGDMTPNAYIWVSQTGITHNSTLGSYVRLYKRDGSTSTLLPSGNCINCLSINEPTPTPTGIPLITVNIYGQLSGIPYDATTNNVQLIYQTYYAPTLNSPAYTTSGIQKSTTESGTFLISPSVNQGGNLNLGVFRRVQDGECAYREIRAYVFADDAFSVTRFDDPTGAISTYSGIGQQGSIYGVSIPISSQSVDIYVTYVGTDIQITNTPPLPCIVSGGNQTPL